MKIIIKDFQVIPYVRMTRYGKYIKERAKKYLDNQYQLAWLLKAHALKENFKFPVGLDIVIGQKKVRHNADLDNYLKAVLDALQKAQIIPNDSLKYINKITCNVKKTKNDIIRIKFLN